MPISYFFILLLSLFFAALPTRFAAAAVSRGIKRGQIKKKGRKKKQKNVCSLFENSFDARLEAILVSNSAFSNDC
jgi:hypothetical protein